MVMEFTPSCADRSDAFSDRSVHYSNKEMTAFRLYLFTSYPFEEIYLDRVRLNASTTCSRDIHFKKYIQIGRG